MLVLSRRRKEAIRFPGINVTVQVVAIKPGVVRLGIEAPSAITILREELPAAGRRPAPQPGAPAGARKGAELDHLLQAASRRLGLALLRLQAGQEGDAEALLRGLQQGFLRLRQRRRDSRRAGPLAPVGLRKGRATGDTPAAAHD